jgi:hypothetical protein
MLPPRQRSQESAQPDGQASIDGDLPGSAALPGNLPESRIATSPETQLDFDERQDIRATRDEKSLKLNIRWKWHLTAQRLVIYVGPSGFSLVVLVLTRELGLAPQTALKLSLACLASATAGHFSREFLSTLSGKRRSRHHRSEDDLPRSKDGRPS